MGIKGNYMKHTYYAFCRTTKEEVSGEIEAKNVSSAIKELKHKKINSD